ncbi:MAG: AI-2E family transporter [Candidatus Paceibacterota bacterium]
MNNSKIKVSEISFKTIIYFYLIPLILFALWYFRSLILIGLLAFIVASLFDRPILFFEKKIKNHFVSVILVYILFLAFLAGFSYFVYPFLKDLILSFSEMKLFSQSLISIPQTKVPISTDFSLIYFLKQYLSLKGNLSPEIVNELFNFLTKIFGGISFAFITFLLAFFLNLEKNSIEKLIRFFSPKKYEEYFISLWFKVRQRIGGWFFSQTILSLIVGLLVYFSFYILGLPYKELLAILAGIFDFLPYLGPLIIGLLSFLVALSENLFLGLIVLGIFILIQVIEAVISPFIRAKTMDIHPLLIIASILVGGKLAGFLGIIIALPFSACVLEFIRDLQKGKLKFD